MEKLRAPRVFGISGFDFIGTLVIAWILSYKFGWDLGATIVILMIIAELTHCMFRIDTPVTQYLCKSRI